MGAGHFPMKIMKSFNHLILRDLNHLIVSGAPARVKVPPLLLGALPCSLQSGVPSSLPGAVEGCVAEKKL